MSELKPCPFCGAGETDVRQSTFWTGMRNNIISVSIHHWCAVKDNNLRPHIEMIGKTYEQAAARWNERAALEEMEDDEDE